MFEDFWWVLEMPGTVVDMNHITFLTYSASINCCFLTGPSHFTLIHFTGHL